MIMNKVILVGRLTREPDIRYSQGAESMATARFTLAVDRRFKKENEQNADFIGCFCVGKTAEIVEKYCHKGTKIVTDGRIQTGSYTKKDGTKVYTTDVFVENIEFAESKANSSNDESNAASSEPIGTDENGFMSIPDNVDYEGLPFN